MTMTEIEKKQIRIMLNEQKRRQTARIAAMNAADPKGVTREDLNRRKDQIEEALDRR